MKFTGTEKQVRLAEEIRRDLAPLIRARITNLTDQRATSAARLAIRPRNLALSEQIADLDDEIAYLRDAVYCRDAKWWIDHRVHGLGMDIDEVVRLKQLTGLASLFTDREYSEAWEAE